MSDNKTIKVLKNIIYKKDAEALEYMFTETMDSNEDECLDILILLLGEKWHFSHKERV